MFTKLLRDSLKQFTKEACIIDELSSKLVRLLRKYPRKEYENLTLEEFIETLRKEENK